MCPLDYAKVVQVYGGLVVSGPLNAVKLGTKRYAPPLLTTKSVMSVRLCAVASSTGESEGKTPFTNRSRFVPIACPTNIDIRKLFMNEVVRYSQYSAY